MDGIWELVGGGECCVAILKGQKVLKLHMDENILSKISKAIQGLVTLE